MKEALEMTLLYPTLPLSVLLAFVLIYWMVSATGLLGDHGDHGVGHHGDPGVDFTHHHHHHHHHAGEHVGMSAWMDKLGFSSVPLTILVSIFVLFMWIITYAIHSTFLSGASDVVRWTVGSVVLVGSFALAVIPASLFIIPIRWLIQKFSVSSSEERNIRGHEGDVVSPFVSASEGRVSVSSSAQGAVMVLPARSLSGQRYPLGTPIVVVDYDEEEKVCRVVSKDEFLSDK